MIAFRRYQVPLLRQRGYGGKAEQANRIRGAILVQAVGKFLQEKRTLRGHILSDPLHPRLCDADVLRG